MLSLSSMFFVAVVVASDVTVGDAVASPVAAFAVTVREFDVDWC